MKNIYFEKNCLKKSDTRWFPNTEERNMSNEYEVYRTTTLGLALQETLDDMIQVELEFIKIIFLLFCFQNCSSII